MIAFKAQLERPDEPPRPSRLTNLGRPATCRSSGEQGVVTQLATRLADIKAALRLVHQAYVEKGLIQPNPYELRVTPYHLLPTTHVFLARQRAEVMGTLSLVGDNELGLPMEHVFSEEVAARRAQATVAEVSCLADRGQGKSSMLAVIVQLMSHMAQFARRHGVDELLIAVHPHHVGFYERFIGFEVIGDERSYSSVCDHPAVAMALDLVRMPVNHPRAYDRFFGKPLPPSELELRSPTDHTLSYLRKVVLPTADARTHRRRAFAA